MSEKLLLFPSYNLSLANVLKFVHDLSSADKALNSCEVSSCRVLDINGFSNCMLLSEL